MTLVNYDDGHLLAAITKEVEMGQTQTVSATRADSGPVRRTRSSRKMASRRERKKQETRQRLLTCAWQLFQEKGYDDTTVEDVTEAADVGKGTFFNYFDTKEAILDEIALWRIELLAERILGVGDVPDSAVARIKLMIQAMSDEFSPERELPQHLLIARISAPIRHESAHRLGSIMHELVSQGQAKGEIRDDMEASLIARLLMTCAFHHFMHCYDPQDRPYIPDTPPLEASVDALMDGLAGPGWRTS